MMQSFRQWVASKKKPLKKYQLVLARDRERDRERQRDRERESNLY